jgi:hypothetical protein
VISETLFLITHKKDHFYVPISTTQYIFLAYDKNSINLSWTEMNYQPIIWDTRWESQVPSTSCSWFPALNSSVLLSMPNINSSFSIFFKKGTQLGIYCSYKFVTNFKQPVSFTMFLCLALIFLNPLKTHMCMTHNTKSYLFLWGNRYHHKEITSPSSYENLKCP